MSSTNIVKAPLTQPERDDLARLEVVVEHGLTNFVEVGNALLEISERRLYRDTHSTFADYVEDKWKMTARRAYQLCEAAEVVKSLPENVNHGSQINERQARELAKVEPERRVKVIQTAAAAGRVTAKAIKLVVQPEDQVVELNPRKAFRTASKGAGAAQDWWYKNATPRQRGVFMGLLLGTGGRVNVWSKAHLRKRFEQWMELYVTELPQPKESTTA